VPRGPAGDELAYAIFTSGSTGTPKPVLVSNANLAAYLDWIIPELALEPTDRVLAFASPTFDATTEELYPALLCGASVALRPADVRVPDASFDALLETTRPTVLSLPVTFWHAWVDRLAREDGRVPEYVRMLLLNAEEPSVHRYRQWCAAGGAHVRFVNTYGPTEATVTATLYEPDGETAHEIWDRFPIGTALAGIEAHILDGSGRPVPDGAVGELCLGGPSVTRGYGGQPGLTAAAYRPDPFHPGARLYHTGDLVRRLSDGTLLMLGRGDRQVKIRGHRVELGEVEAALLGHPAVEQAAVLATGTGEFRQLVAYVAGDAPGLRDHLAERLPHYMVPARLLVLPELPLSANRKVDRRALADRVTADLAAVPSDRPTAAEPDTETQRRLHTIWCKVLGRPDIGVHDNFFSIGGDSIRGLSVVTLARDAGLALTVRDLFDRQTIAALAAHADTAASAVSTDSVVSARVTGLSDSQLRGALARLRKG
jgi:amino acid adenylation domain-containing protein